MSDNLNASTVRYHFPVASPIYLFRSRRSDELDDNALGFDTFVSLNPQKTRILLDADASANL
ncbi:hypothetical protein NKH56_35495 [Mesorhizobium sp. M1076]|uniref:hypothetical protein n=1 Tax=Mesorhizobium sp. M1076 TaxID=2957054 RepID=UPI003339BD7A